MEFKGTQGPWQVRQEVDEKYDQPIFNIDTSDGSEESIITVWSGLNIDDNLDDRTTANALLISKAPEMLALLQECADTFVVCDSSDRMLKLKIQELIKSATQI
ncbi:hypothetical protein ACR79T_12675 [Sphingobacterium spiritivorum]|uniref:hypothetical protein n=1 Tax=Sphingobacterium spiritivorum TaxID=258 RepID=UPI003DA1FBEB